MSIKKLTEISNRYGSDEKYVLAGGGNTSYKKDGVIYVKGSGTALATITPDDFVAMDIKKLNAMLRKKYPADNGSRQSAALFDMIDARLPGEEHKRPSIEAILHAMFPQKFVLHVHPALVNGLSCSLDGKKKCAELFGGDVVWVPLTKLGYELALTCRKLFAAHEKKTGKRPSLAILQNHGIFAAADTVKEIDALMDVVFKKISAGVKEEPDFSPAEFDRKLACETAPALRMLYMMNTESSTGIAVFCANKSVLKLVKDESSLSVLMGPFTPDHIVYCKARPLFIKPGDDYKAKFARFIKANGYAPKIAIVKGLGFFALGKTKKEAEIAKMLFLDAVKIAVYAKSFGGALHLPDDYTKFILSWEFEAYRQKVALSATGNKRLDGKIAIVTGGAQGFGKGIAEAMAAHGAYLVIADLNAEGADACAKGLCEAHGENIAVPAAANVADEASVESMVEEAVLNYGGLDALVSNAGIAIAGSLPEMTKQKFELVTSVNYTGYFLCVKYACVPMKIQRAVNPGYMADIIEVNSKSGLEGSNKNFAYAGSKFGGVGLTQSFAMELVEYGIKVNAICPGNLLDGPLWSDPEKGLFKQYFEAGKVPGAKSVGEVRRFYESKVPMHRGCTTDDVACAILYLVEQKYETGQALPVTGGQIMLK